MTFMLSTVTVAGRQFAALNNFDHAANKVTLITGANGTGKTRLLSGLAVQFSGKSHSSDSSVRDVQGVTSSGSLAGPSRVVAQTFSPFSRFPRERTRALSLEEYLQPPSLNYVAIGFTRSTGLRGSVSKDAVSRIARKLHTQPEQAAPLANALRSLGFEPRLRIAYYRSPVGRNLDLKEPDETKLCSAVDEFLAELAAKSNKSGEEIRITREIASQPRVELTKKLINAIRAVQPSLPNAFNEHRRREFAIDLPLMEDALMPRDELEGAIVLARLGLLRVSDCVLWTIPGGRWRKETQNSIVANELSIVDASSGEQQLLSSLFGLVAEMQDDALVLIDEPELSLHPSWQTQFLDLLSLVIRPFNGCHVLVATHSPLLAQRGQELGIPVLSLDENRKSTHTSDAPPSVEQTLIDVFELPVRDSTYVGRLLLSLVMGAEQNPNSAAISRLRIEELQELYERATVPDKNTLALIHDALELIEQGPQERGDGRGEA
ncbi:MAG: ATP-binding protein [Dechloromonas sp.]|nr:ATP-binding protein [Dechloromonas sp.]